MEFSSDITCYRMASAGMGATIIPALTAEMAAAGDETEIFSLSEKAVTWEVRAFFRKGVYIGEPEQELISLADEIFNACNYAEARQPSEETHVYFLVKEQ